VAMDPQEALRAGVEILAPLMTQHAFAFRQTSTGRSSGGAFAAGEFVRGDRRLELHFRHSLGLVTYHMGSLNLSHADYMRALLGPGAGSQYPGFSEDPLDGFRGLLHDLEHYAGDFLSGSGQDFERCHRDAQRLNETLGFKRLSSFE
jgi:hypothetical protein